MLFKDLDKWLYLQQVQPPIADLPNGSTLPATYIDVSEFDWFAFLLFLGATDRTNTNIQAVQATSSGGAGSKNISGATFTAFGATDDNKFGLLICRAAALDINNSFRYVACTITDTGGAACLGSILFAGYRARRVAVTQPAALAQVIRVP